MSRRMSREDLSLATWPLGKWRLVEGHKPTQVTIEERADRGNRLQIRWWVANASDPKQGRYWKAMLDGRLHPDSVRDARSDIDEVALNKLQTLAKQVRGELLVGRDPAPLVRPPLVAPLGPTAPLVAAAGPLTIRRGVELAFPDTSVPGERGGVYGRDGRTAREMRAAALRAVEAAERLLGPGAMWDQLRASLWRQLGDMLLEWKRPLEQADPKAPGLRSAEQAVAALARAASWLNEEGLLELVARPPRNWRQRLSANFEQATNLSATPPRPRHQRWDAGRILQAVYDLESTIDPRIRLHIGLGLELRGGQALRTRRSALTLDDSGAFKCGRWRAPSVGKKRGPLVDLTPEERALVDWALQGYLADLEAAYQAGTLTDYYIVPAKRLRRGRAVVRALADSQPLARRQALKLFRELETVAGVPSKQQQGWYGLRRVATDLADEVTQDEIVRQVLGGWQPANIRQSVYRDLEDPLLLRRVAEARGKLRALMLTAAKTPERPADDEPTTQVP